MSHLIAGSSKCKIATTISRHARERIDKIMARPDHPTLTDVLGDLILAGLDSTGDLILRYPSKEDIECRTQNGATSDSTLFQKDSPAQLP